MPATWPVLVFDIETIPDVAGLRRLRGADPALSNEQVLAQEVAQRAADGRSDFMPHYLQRIVAISCVFRGGEGLRVHSFVDRSRDGDTSEEARIVQLFFNTVEKRVPQLVSWNGGGFDLMIQAMSGLMSVTGPKDGPPYRIPLAISDVGAGLYLTIGVLAALQARQKTGEGQWVETSLLEATVSLGVYEAANYFANGKRPEKLGQAHRGSSPYQVFQTADGWLTIGGAQQNFFRKLCAMIGKPELADDPRFKTNAERVGNNDLIVGLLQKEVAKRSTADWMTALEAEGIPAGPVLHHDEVFADPQILARGMVAEVEHAKAGRQKTLGVPLKMSATQGDVRRAAPTLGQHDNEIRRARGRAKIKGGK